MAFTKNYVMWYVHPCPLCGGRFHVWFRWVLAKAVMCPECKLVGPVRLTEKSAVASWNRQVPVCGEKEGDRE